MDATLKGIPLNKQKVEEVFNDIFSVEVEDGVLYELVSIKDIRLENQIWRI